MSLITAIERFVQMLSSVGSLRGSQPTATPAEPQKGLVLGLGTELGSEGPDHLVLLNESVRSKSLLLFGQSGAGKSTLMHRLRDHDLDEGVTLVDCDFRGDSLDRSVIRMVGNGIDPNGVCVIDLRDRDYVTPMNFLGGGPGDPGSRAGALYTVLESESESWGVQLASDLRFSLQALAAVGGSLLDVERLLSPSGSEFREFVASTITDGYTTDYINDYDALPAEIQRSRHAAVANKLHPLIYHPDLRLMLGQSGAPDFREMLDTPGRATFISFGADRVPNARLVSKLFILSLQRHILGRVDSKQQDRNPVRLYVDELATMVTPAFADLVAEIRRFGGSLNLALQQTGQLPSEVRQALRTNCFTQFYFQTGAVEASELVAEIVADLPREAIRKTMLTLPVGSALLMERGKSARLVRLTDSPDPRVSEALIRDFREATRPRIALPRAEAEAFVAAGSSRTLGQGRGAEHEIRHEKRPGRWGNA